MSKEITIKFGAMAEPICQQTGIQNTEIAVCQRLADAITLLRIQGLLTDSQCHAARKKLVKRIGQAVSTALAEDDKRRTTPAGKEEGDAPEDDGEHDGGYGGTVDAR